MRVLLNQATDLRHCRQSSQASARTDRRTVTKPTSTPSSNSSNIHSRLLSYHEVPSWYQDNKYIFHGYRPVTRSVYHCLTSLSYVHNETGNILSHLIPAVSILLCEPLFFRYFSQQYPDATITDFMIFGFFLLTAGTCFALSSAYHTLLNHSADVSNLWLRVDYMGILFLTLGDFVSALHVGFYCEPTLKRTYMTMASIDKSFIFRQLIDIVSRS